VALAGNPNTGTSTVFNALTGSHQHVGNWPGKTVERKVGTWRHDGLRVEVVDLPGTYSLSAFSMEEEIARDHIVDAGPDLVIVVVDAANLERNLYLVVQILEMEVPVVVALNMTDVAEARGYGAGEGRDPGRLR
jgi:ferrous iron transport protein B